MSIVSTIALLRNRGASRRLRFLAALSLFAFVYFWFMTSIVTWLSMFHIVPLQYGNTKSTVLKHFAAILFLLFNVVGNFINIIRVDTTLNALRRFPKVKDKDFHLVCPKCERGVPRRTHHCSLCNMCVLKQDHHCLFMCTCIGYFNQKYFCMFSFYLTISGLYTSILFAIYMLLLYKVRLNGFFAVATLLLYTLQDWCFLAENPPTSNQLAIVGIFHACLASCLVGAATILWQVYLVSQGLTTHEAHCNISKFSRSFWDNFVDVFGPYWFVTLLLPIPLPQKSDGTYSHKAASVTTKKGTDTMKKKPPPAQLTQEKTTTVSHRKEKES